MDGGFFMRVKKIDGNGKFNSISNIYSNLIKRLIEKDYRFIKYYKKGGI